MRRVIRTFVMIGMVLLMVQPTFAASEYTMPDGYYSENVTLNSMGLDGKYFTYLDLAVSEWNSAKIGYSQIYRDKYVKKITTGTLLAGPNYIQSSTYADAFLGVYIPTAENSNMTQNKTTSFTIYINERTTPDKWARSTICHELGHIYGLNDVRNSEAILMNHNRDRETVFSPTVSDIAHAKTMWYSFPLL